MKGDIYKCPTCHHTIREADCEYTEVVCHRTGACRRNRSGCTPMLKVQPQDHGV